MIELGPGNGTLLVDILTTTKSFKNFHDNINIKLIEKNKHFIKKQSSLDYFTYSINNSSCIKSHLGFFTEIVSLKSLKKIPNSVEQHYLENVTEYIYEEKKVENKAPITKVKIDNISIDKKQNTKR